MQSLKWKSTVTVAYCHRRSQIFSAKVLRRVVKSSIFRSISHPHASPPRVSLRGRLQVTSEIPRIHRSARRSHPDSGIRRDLPRSQRNLICYVSHRLHDSPRPKALSRRVIAPVSSYNLQTTYPPICTLFGSRRLD